MKITNITIENLGPYVGVKTLSFSVDDVNRKVVLIGGKNGAGKTTLFNAIRVGIYGCKAYGFDSENSKYTDLISQLINTSARLQKEGYARIKISILLDDGKYNNVYTFDRSWKLFTKTIRESLIVLKNDEVLSETEKSDLESYLLQILPPDMFQFYFFDGEGISDFVFNGRKNTDFKNAFLKLCGLDTMEIIHENFLRLSNIRQKDTVGVLQAYQDVLALQSKCQNDLQIKNDEKESIISALAVIDDKLVKREKDFASRGGISNKEYQAMQLQISKEENNREVKRRWLKDIGNDVLPFVILRSQLLELKERILLEEKYQEVSVFKDILTSQQTKKQLDDVFGHLGIEYNDDLTDKVIDTLTSNLEVPCDNIILNLSKRESYNLLGKINNLLAFDKTRVYEANKSVEESLLRVKQIRKKLEKSDSSNADAYLEEKERLLKKKQFFVQRLVEVELELNNINFELGEIDVKLKKAQQRYEDFLKAKSVDDVAARALLAFSDLQQRLYKKYIKDVEVNFRECFNSLINKSDLIDGIKIDEQLQVYPYKLKTFFIKDLKNAVNKFGENYVSSELGSVAYEIYDKSVFHGESEITLPVEVKQQLSAGEKQIFIMALYQALSLLNKITVPYIIDTPFARIDTEHRQNILNNFFMKLKGQVIILSTDEEIVESYKESIDETVSDIYLLKHMENNGTEILKDTYFGR